MVINIVNDEQYRFLRQMLGLPSSLNSWDVFEVGEDNSISVGGKKVYVQFEGEKKDINFFKIIGSRHKQEIAKITLAKKYMSAIFEMPTEG